MNRHHQINDQNKKKQYTCYCMPQMEFSKKSVNVAKAHPINGHSKQW